MKVSILGNGLTSLALAKMLVNQGIKVDIFSNQKIKKINKNQTLGISKTNINFFNENILNINKFLWNINKIEIFSESLKNDKILNFENNSETLFSIVKNFDLYNYIYLSLNKNKLVKFKKKINYQNLIKKDYKLIFNCDYNHPISKSFFYKKIKKNYNGYAHISVIKHEKLVNNFVASQIFTKKGPLAFLPISSTETSIVFSVKGKKDIDFVNLIKKYNNRYNIFKMTKSLSFELKSSNLRTYHHGNIIAFGDLLHKLHPLAGQGFNMTIRDIKKILELIKFKKEHGLDLDKSICKDFERNTKSKNYLFANSIDFIYEFFNFENKIRNNTLSKSVRFLGKNKMINKFFTNLADAGISI
jgi:2-octaprenyl-6-methoxyphenol hydroxylase